MGIRQTPANNSTNTGERRLSALVIVSFLLMAFANCSVNAFAQTDSESHRRLELPEGRSAGMQQQLLQLQQLQALLSQSQQPSGDPQTSAKDSAAQMQMFQDLLKSFGGQIPPNAMPNLENLSPELVSSVMSDPNKRKQMEDMLKQFAQDRRLPRGAPGRGPSILPNSQPEPQRNNSTRPPTQPPTTPAQRPTSPSPNDSGNPGEVESVDDLVRMAKEFQEKYLNEQSSPQNGTGETPENNSGRPTSGSPSSQRPSLRKDENQNPVTDLPMPQSDAEWNRLLEQFSQNKFGQNNSNGNAAARSQQADRNAAERDAVRPGGSQRPFGNTPGGQSSPVDQLPMSTVTELLKHLQNQRPGELNTGGAGTTGNRNAIAGTTESPDGTPINDQTPGPSSDEVSEELRQQRQEMKSDLEKNGFQHTLRQLVRDAQKEAKSARTTGTTSGGSTSATGQPASEGAFLRTIDGLRKDIVELAKDAKFKPPKNTSPSRASNARPPARSRPSERSAVGEFGRSASKFFTEMVSTPQSLSTPPSAPRVSGTPSLAGGTGNGLLTFVLLIVLAVAGFFLARKYGLVGASRDDSQLDRRIAPSQIRTKADVVHAFHQLAMKPDRNTEEWWTHRRVVGDLVRQSPDRTYQAQILAELYEQARYLPDDAEFTESQIQEARHAIRQCER